MIHPLHWIDIFGFWVGVFLTFCVLSYLYKDNPFYKLAEHLFVGVSLGAVITQQYYNTLKPNLIDHFSEAHWWIYLFPLALVLLLFLKAASRKLAWLGRYPLAFVVAFYAGLQVNAAAQADLAEQAAASMQPLVVDRVNVNTASATDMSTLPGFSPPLAQKVVDARAAGAKFDSLDQLMNLPGLTRLQREDLAAQRGPIAGLDAQASVRNGDRYWFGIFSRLLLLIGMVASLVYFYFSIEQKGAIGRVARFGVWVLMVGFGASFGLTVQGRLSLAVGRVLDVMDRNKSPEHAAQIHGPWVAMVSIVLIILGIVIWERMPKKPVAPEAPDEPRATGDDPNEEDPLPPF